MEKDGWPRGRFRGQLRCAVAAFAVCGRVGRMASYHLSVKTIKRSAGRSATAAAAYRAGAQMLMF